MSKLSTALGISILLITNIAFAQQYTIRGTIVDKTDNNTPLPSVSVSISDFPDSTVKKGTITDVDGKFSVNDLPSGRYQLSLSYIGYKTQTQTVNLIGADADLGRISLEPNPTTLKNVTITEQQIRTEQLGDTTQFNANAYKTNPDANAEDLLKKMPGIQNEDGKLKAGGEEVKRILVDGKPFFGDDPATAIKNLPAEIIDKIQVFDKLSDQSQFTGFDDGNAEKTINIVTKPGRNQGNFGKVYGGYGTDNRYIAGGNLNFFKGDRRVSVIALSNNINQQNFNTDDLVGALGSSGSQGRGRGPGRGSGINNFLVGQQGGITATNAVGLNYSDNWGKKIKVTGSYFFNQTQNDNQTRLSRQYFTSADSSLVYNENSTASTQNINHRANLRLEYNIDSSNSLVLTPRISIQDYNATTTLLGINNLPGDILNSRTENNKTSGNTGYNFGNDLLFRHKFAKKGRTVSVMGRTELNNKDGDGKIYSLNEFINSDTTLLDQEYTLISNGYKLSGSLNYTEPLSEKSQLQFDYRPSYSSNTSDKETDNLDVTSGTYRDLDTLLSNKYDNTYTTQSVGLGYRYNDKKASFMASVAGQYSVLEGTQQFPYSFDLRREFKNILPRAMFNYKFSKTKNLRVYYRGSVDEPNISQLQSVVNNSNPLLLTTGNPGLVQDFEHRLVVRYSGVNTTTNRNIYAFLYANYIFDYIGNQTFIPRTDTMFSDGILVNKGAQLSRPINIDGYASARSLLTYSLPVSGIKSNMNLSGGVNYSKTPALINNLTNFSNNYGFTGGVSLSSNISENVDFTLSYNGNYNTVKNTIQAQSDNAYYSQTTTAKLNLIFLKGFVFNTDINHYLYTGLSQSFNQSFFLWNAAFGYKFLKNRSLEAKVTVFDILNQNRAISRNVTETYIEDNYTQVLQQYFMFTLTYTLRNFKGNSAPAPQDKPDRGDWQHN